MFMYRKATLEDLERIWDSKIMENPDDPRYLRWKDAFISQNTEKRAATFVILDDTDPVGEVTLDYHASSYSGNRSLLADGSDCAYVCALRILKEYEGHGFVSELMRSMENYAANIGFSRLTIGVEATQTRTLSIYRHWGYNRFIKSEENDGEQILFYEKALPSLKSKLLQ